MSEEFEDIITEKMRYSVIENLLRKGKRLDDRGYDDFRNVRIKKGVITSADGSALVSVGHTQVLAGVKLEVGTPYPDKPDEGVMITSAEFLPSAAPEFEIGPPGEDAIELARVVDRGIRSAESFDPKGLKIDNEHVYMLFLDLYILDHHGDLIGASSIAAISALLDTKIPKVEDGKIIYGEYIKELEIRNIPLAMSFVRIGDTWLVDPLKEEEDVCDVGIVITTVDKDKVCGMQKTKGALDKDGFLNVLDIALKTAENVRKKWVK